MGGKHGAHAETLDRREAGETRPATGAIPVRRVGTEDSLWHRRRVLVISYQRFLAADRAWIEASDAAREWVRGMPKSVLAIGAPRSRIRSLYSKRERALTRLQVAKLKLEEARVRFEVKQVKVHPALLGSIT